MSIYTRAGDSGETSTLKSKRVSKDDPRVEACGAIDELNALLGICVSFCEYEKINGMLMKIQADLFSIGAELAGTKKPSKITAKRISDMEQIIDVIEKDLPTLKHFVVPGGNKNAALFHHARTVCRRAERVVVALTKKEKINKNILIYLNRLSDLLFMLARLVNKKKKTDEAQWTSAGIVFIPGLLPHPDFDFGDFGGFF